MAKTSSKVIISCAVTGSVHTPTMSKYRFTDKLQHFRRETVYLDPLSGSPAEYDATFACGRNTRADPLAQLDPAQEAAGWRSRDPVWCGPSDVSRPSPKILA